MQTEQACKAFSGLMWGLSDMQQSSLSESRSMQHEPSRDTAGVYEFSGRAFPANGTFKSQDLNPTPMATGSEGSPWSASPVIWGQPCQNICWEFWLFSDMLIFTWRKRSETVIALRSYFPLYFSQQLWYILAAAKSLDIMSLLSGRNTDSV